MCVYNEQFRANLKKESFEEVTSFAEEIFNQSLQNHIVAKPYKLKHEEVV